MGLLNILFLLINLTYSYNIPSLSLKDKKTKVTLNLERFNERYNLPHWNIFF